MAFCNQHGFYKDGTECNTCKWIEWDKRKKTGKATNSIQKTYNKKINSIAKANEKKKENQKLVKEILAKNPTAKVVKQNTKSRAELKANLQSLWSAKFKIWAKENNLYYDWITGEKKEGKKLFSFHVSHYFSKSIYWMLWTHPVNSGILTYDQNVNKAHNIAAMRPMMVKIHGKKEVDKLEALQQEYDLKLKTGQMKSQPPIDWLIAQIQELKQIKKNVK